MERYKANKMSLKFVVLIFVSSIAVGAGKIYERCELARELYKVHKLPMEQIPTWICIVNLVSSFDTSAVRSLDYMGYFEHGIFKLSDQWWCTTNDTHRGCGKCEKFEDDDITDDVECIKQVYAEHERYFGNGFNAWSQYKTDCKENVSNYTRGCFEKASKTYDRCELAKELRYKHMIPVDQVGEYVCYARYATEYTTSSSTDTGRGIFLIHNSWCKPDENCKLDCEMLLDDDIGDDVACIKHIFAELGFFNGWPTYSDHNCGNRSSEFVEGCFDDASDNTALATTSAPLPSSTQKEGRIFDRCELARELREKQNIPVEKVGNWVCLARFASDYTTSHSNDEHRGIFLIHKSWCDGSAIGCDITCDKLLDDDISDDVTCMKQIHTELGYFIGGTIYKERNCGERASEFVEGCFDEPKPKSKVYNRCELARQLRSQHDFPHDKIGDWVCVAESASNLITSYRATTGNGIFQIDDSWCATATRRCIVSCDKLLDSDIADDVACMEIILEAHPLISDWRAYKNYNCEEKAPRFVRECFDLLALVHFSD